MYKNDGRNVFIFVLLCEMYNTKEQNYIAETRRTTFYRYIIPRETLFPN